MPNLCFESTANATTRPRGREVRRGSAQIVVMYAAELLYIELLYFYIRDKYVHTNMNIKLELPELRFSTNQWHVANSRLTLDVNRAICILVDNLQFLGDAPDGDHQSATGFQLFD